LQDVQIPKSPLVLKALGSFFVGGETEEQTTIELGVGLPGHRTVNQMYVQFMLPNGKNRVPVVLVHGGTLTGKVFETQPDGRMGWAEYFVRKGYPVYLPEQVSRGRSGFNHAIYNNVRAGIVAPNFQPNIIILSGEQAWTHFRFGPLPGVPFADTQFPVEAISQFSKQAIPDLNPSLPVPNPNFQRLSDLALEVKGAVVVGHSESGRYPLEAALVNPEGTKGLIVMEPGNCDGYTDSQVASLAEIPILIVWGDHIDTPGSILAHGPAAFAGCLDFIARIQAEGGNARMLHLPDELGPGNSHMMMTDKNSDQVADLLISWIEENVPPQGKGNPHN
jgi:pimeloyl-ACP methyl ester carboxylesterase